MQVVDGILLLPPSLAPFEHQRTRTSFPVCLDCVRRLAEENPALRVSGRLQARLDARASAVTRARAAGADDTPLDGAPGLLPRQAAGVRWLLEVERGLLADSQGTGKTVVSLVAAARAGRRAVVICANTKRPDWIRHIREWTDLDPVQIEAADDYESPRPGQIFVIGYEAARRNGRSLRGDVLIVDEAHKLRNRKASITWEIGRIARRFRHLYLLTATPVVNGASDVWTLLRMLDRDRFSSFWDFVARFMHLRRGYFGVGVGSLRKEEEVHYWALLDEYMLTRGKDLATLPRLVRRAVSYELPGAQREIYDAMAKKSAATYDDHEVEAVEVVAQITRLRQIAIDPGLIWSTYDGPSKFDSLVSLFVERRVPTVVFSMFAEAALRAVERLRAAGFAAGSLTGQDSAQQREAVMLALSEGELDALVVTYGTGGEGLNLVAAERVIFLDLAWNPAGNEQARDRIYRYGQRAEEVEAVYVRAIKTIEDDVLAILRRKEPVTVERLAARLR